jgi:UDP-N-acetylglucosamine 4-epimerase
MLQGEPIYINGDGETSRDFCFIANVVQANLLAATAVMAPSPEPKIYNIAVGDRTTLNELFHLLRDNLSNPVIASEARPSIPEPIYRDFRAGDVRHSLADISKAKNQLGYAPTQRIAQGLALAMPWYVSHGQSQTERNLV